MYFYTLWYNKSLQDSYAFRNPSMPVPRNHELIFIQQSIDNAILQLLHEKEGDMLKPVPKIETTYSDYPAPLDRMF